MGRPVGLLLTALLALVCATPAWGADASVTAGPDLSFHEPSVTINPGEKVTWTNAGGIHNVHFEDGKYTAPVIPSSSWSSLVSRRFVGGGVYRYYCRVHGAPGGIGMSGTVNVQTPAAASYTWVGGPTLAPWTNPANWSPAGVPGGNPADIATISAARPELDVDATIGGLTLTGGGGRSGPGELTVLGSGPLTWGFAWIDGPGTTVIGPNRTVNWNGTVTGRLRNLGTLNWNGGAIGDGGAPDPSAVVDNDGVLNVSVQTFSDNSGAAGRLENGGTLRATGEQVVIRPRLSNSGLVEAVGAKLILMGGQASPSNGDFLVPLGRTLTFNDKPFNLEEGAQVSGAGEVRIVGTSGLLAVPDLPGTGYDVGRTEVSFGARIDLDRDGSTGQLTMDGFDGRTRRGGDGTLTVGAGASSLDPNATFVDAGLTVFGATSEVTVQGMDIYDSARVRFDGDWTAPSTIQLGKGTGPPEAPELHIGGTLSLSAGTFAAGIYDATDEGTAVLRVLDGGRITKDTAGVFELGPRVANAGTIEGSRGIIGFTGASAGPSPGELKPGVDASFVFAGNVLKRAGYELGAGGTVGGAGELRIRDATFTALPGSAYDALTTRLESGGRLSVHTGDASTGGLVAGGGSRDGPGSLSIGLIAGDGTATFADGLTTVAGRTMASEVALTGGANVRFPNGLNNTGTITWGDGVGSDGGRVEVGGTLASLGTLENNGSIGSALRLLGSGSFSSTGTQAIPVTLETLGTLTVDGTLSAPVKVLGGVTGGAGAIGGDLSVEGGTLRPGGATPGTLTVLGNYTQTGGTFEERIGGAGAFDVLAVGGTATLGGTLAIVRDPAFTPASGSQLRFITSGGQPGGAFAALTGAAVGPNAFEVRKDASGAFLALTAPTATATATATTTTTAAAPTTTATPTASPTPVATHRTVGVATLATLPSNRRCVGDRGLSLRLRTPPGERLIEARIEVTRKRDIVVRGAGLTRTLKLRGLPRARFTVTITVRSADGDTFTARRTYRACRAGGG